MKDRTWIILIILGILMLSVIILSFNNPNQVSEEFAKHLGENSILYISNGCLHCHQQLEMFGEYVTYLNIIDCTKEPHKCLEAEIIRVPTWIIDSEKYEGVQSIEELKEFKQKQNL